MYYIEETENHVIGNELPFYLIRWKDDEDEDDTQVTTLFYGSEEEQEGILLYINYHKEHGLFDVHSSTPADLFAY